MSPTASRVPEHTAVHLNRPIERETEASVMYFAERRE